MEAKAEMIMDEARRRFGGTLNSIFAGALRKPVSFEKYFGFRI